MWPRSGPHLVLMDYTRTRCGPDLGRHYVAVRRSPVGYCDLAICLCSQSWQRPWLEGVSSGELEQGRGQTAKAREREGQREREHTLFKSQVAGNSLYAATPPAAVINQA
ncbi:hypothetical protein DPX16_20827 [Anabarilius grahami]|uniref:Uncharacterized protein n=1 Tax=Anabarilius grahami TaxID=495550 RepID=A0A3N0ZAN7_ANAGA|nr:hypothetical protein DPX16_20827 [Anabarilius grahami]